MPPSNNVITSFLSTLIGQPHFGAEGPRNASIVTRRTFPYVGGAAGHETNPYGKVRLVTIDAFLGPTRQFGLCNFRNWAPKVRLALLNFGCR